MRSRMFVKDIEFVKWAFFYNRCLWLCTAVTGRKTVDLQERTHEILEKFRNRPFDELVEHVHNENEETDLSRTLHRLMQRSNDTNRLNEYILREKPKNIFELKMPASFVY